MYYITLNLKTLYFYHHHNYVESFYLLIIIANTIIIVNIMMEHYHNDYVYKSYFLLLLFLINNFYRLCFANDYRVHLGLGRLLLFFCFFVWLDYFLSLWLFVSLCQMFAEAESSIRNYVWTLIAVLWGSCLSLQISSHFSWKFQIQFQFRI